jgi:competence protein ComEC
LTLTWLHNGPPPERAGAAEVVALDVGQGLAVALRGPRGGQLLVDAGGSADPAFDPGERAVLPHLIGRSGRYLDALVVTHDHVDHVNGAFALLREIEVGELWVGPRAQQGRRLAQLAREARERGTALVLAERGLRREVAGLAVQVLAPARAVAGRRGQNDRSVVLSVGEAPARVLIPGDLEEPGEAELLASGGDLRAEVLVVAHHGSRHGSSAAFLAGVQPRWALVSAGRRNPFGHPHPEVLERLDRVGARVLRTDEMGSVTLVLHSGAWCLRARGQSK